MVMVLFAQEAVTPDGNPVTTPIPFDPVVVCVIAVNAELIQTVGVEEAALTVGRLISTVILSETVQPPAAVVVTL